MTLAALEEGDIVYVIPDRESYNKLYEDTDEMKPRVKTAIIERVDDEFGAKRFRVCAVWNQKAWGTASAKETIEQRTIGYAYSNSMRNFPQVYLEDPKIAISTIMKALFLFRHGRAKEYTTMEDRMPTSRFPFTPLRTGISVAEFLPFEGTLKQWKIVEIKRPYITLKNRKEIVIINQFGQEVRDGKTYFKRFFMQPPNYFYSQLIKNNRWRGVMVNAA